MANFDRKHSTCLRSRRAMPGTVNTEASTRNAPKPPAVRRRYLQQRVKAAR